MRGASLLVQVDSSSSYRRTCQQDPVRSSIKRPILLHTLSAKPLALPCFSSNPDFSLLVRSIFEDCTVWHSSKIPILLRMTSFLMSHPQPCCAFTLKASVPQRYPYLQPIAKPSQVSALLLSGLLSRIMVLRIRG